MIWFETIVISILTAYTILIFVPVFTLLFSKKEDDLALFTPTEKVSVIIPFKNETNTIVKCLESLVEQDFPAELLEIILVDDNSDDNSADIAEDFLQQKKLSYALIDLTYKSKGGKKDRRQT